MLNVDYPCPDKTKTLKNTSTGTRDISASPTAASWSWSTAVEGTPTPDTRPYTHSGPPRQEASKMSSPPTLLGISQQLFRNFP